MMKQRHSSIVTVEDDAVTLARFVDQFDGDKNA
jgi:hypothetical protein